MAVRASILPRLTRPAESFHDAVARIADALGGSERAELGRALGDGRIVPGGQIWRGAGIADAVLYNCFVTAPGREESEIELARRITEWTARGCGVGVDLTEYAQRAGGLRHVCECIGASQQRLWDRGVRRTATMATVDAAAVGVAEVAVRLAQPHLRHLNMGVLASDRAMRDARDQLDSGGGSQAARMRELASAAWHTGNPGLVFVDRVNVGHPFAERITACNPCAEQHLASEEGCNLTSLNIAAFVRGGRLAYDEVEEAAAMALRLLDRAVDASAFPSAAAERLARRRRRVGLGVLGFATALGRLGVAYDDPEAVGVADEVGAALRRGAERASAELADRHGPFAEWRDTTLPRRRNAYLLSVAPTGAISRLWRVSAGIEPALDAEPASWESQLAVVAALQRHVDGGISKTVLLPTRASIGTVLDVMLAAWDLGLKGISVFRLGSRPGQSAA